MLKDIYHKIVDSLADLIWWFVFLPDGFSRGWCKFFSPASLLENRARIWAPYVQMYEMYRYVPRSGLKNES